MAPSERVFEDCDSRMSICKVRASASTSAGLPGVAEPTGERAGQPLRQSATCSEFVDNAQRTPATTKSERTGNVEVSKRKFIICNFLTVARIDSKYAGAKKK